MKAKSVTFWAGIAVSAVVLAVCAVNIYRIVYDRKIPNFRGKTDIYVYPETVPGDIIDTLSAGGHIRNEASLRRMFRKEGAALSVKPGHYVVDSTLTSAYVSRMLRHGWQTPVKLTLSGSIRSPKALARKIGSQMMVDSAAVADFIYCKDSIARYGVDTTGFFTMVIPDTYQIWWTSSTREIFDALKAARDAWWTPERKQKAKKIGLTEYEVSVLASIVDGETRYVPEMPKIACVYLNRLKCGMKLQACPTVTYLYGYTLRRVLKVHLQTQSPYNTYINFGLPPGPISCPSKDCLEAVLNPDPGDYLYFCADYRFNGTNVFASSYSEHLQNARRYQEALTRRQREGK